MRRVGMVMGLVVAFIVVMAIVLSVMSRQQQASGLVEGRLTPCPATPNCVCSEYNDAKSFVEPLHFEGDGKTAWLRVKAAVRESGGEVVRQEDGYLAARYTSLVFRFVDDLELRLDSASGLIHVRSASRVGRSDLGVNSKRVAKLRALFLASAVDTDESAR